MDLFSLTGRVALVTGASGDIGAAIAEGLAAAGAQVALHGRSEQKLARVLERITVIGGEAQLFTADLADLAAHQPLLQAVQSQFGGVDILVNCAGLNRRMPIDAMTPEVYDEIMGANLRGLFFLTQAVIPSMRARGGGKIVNIGSLTSSMGLADVSVYGMTKSALSQLTKTMAIEYATDNIQVNCLCPGFIKTELTVPLWSSPTRNRWILERTPAQRPGLPEDLVGMSILMASRASDFMTGQTVFVDGGFMAGSQW